MEKEIKAWAILQNDWTNPKNFVLAGTQNSLVQNYAIFETKDIAIKTARFAKVINPKEKYKVILVKIVF